MRVFDARLVISKKYMQCEISDLFFFFFFEIFFIFLKFLNLVLCSTMSETLTSQREFVVSVCLNREVEYIFYFLGITHVICRRLHVDYVTDIV